MHLWEHFLYSEDIDYLKWAYPIIKGSVEFLMDRLVTDLTQAKKLFSLEILQRTISRMNRAILYV